MSDTEFQRLILEKLATMEQNIATKKDLLHLETKMDTLEQNMTQLRESQARMEHDLTEKITALFDTREVQKDINDRILGTLGRLEAKIDVLQMETAHIRRIK